MITTLKTIDELAQQRSEWASWLAVVGTALEELAHPAWQTVALQTCATRERNAPLLANSTVEVDANAVRRIYESVIRNAARVGTATMESLQGAADAALDPLAVLEATINRDHERLMQYALDAHAEANAFSAVAALAAMPLLHACSRRREPTVSDTWSQSYCPVCGGWPAFAEVRGIERTRYLRCAGCGSEWQAHGLRCTFCGTTDHEQLASLIPERPTAGGSVEACNACLGYIKTFTVLRSFPGDHIVLHDIATTELDIAAVDRGYRRPTTIAYPLDVKVTDYASANITG